ncbi:hypothetical protein GQ43DRAFT_144699 [Delitschia confertaspora ATCC 74209]|uniref:Uncharacterized protein n=1 Tax=Delitschia confertaspora ATCC 74209 TaxID=1513339 RepID=A0A9P4MQB1_9PLEO|nr:hypothetical protein GQ43DRAFT_144699 [Delitschia confertaspora ATCC 74209]
MIPVCYNKWQTGSQMNIGRRSNGVWLGVCRNPHVSGRRGLGVRSPSHISPSTHPPNRHFYFPLPITASIYPIPQHFHKQSYIPSLYAVHQYNISFSICFSLHAMPVSNHIVTAAAASTITITTKQVTEPYKAPQYRQEEFRNGLVARIQERRHRPHTNNPPKSEPLDYEKMPMQIVDRYAWSRGVSGGPRSPSDHGAVKMGEGVPGPLKTVNESVLRKKPRIVVLHNPTPIKAPTGISSCIVLPPTPRLERLPTPELGELEERLFCNCCHFDPHVGLYCVVCGNIAVSTSQS